MVFRLIVSSPNLCPPVCEADKPVYGVYSPFLMLTDHRVMLTDHYVMLTDYYTINVFY